MRFLIALAMIGACWFAAVPTFADPPPVEAYGKLPAVEQIKLSPSGERYAFVAVVGDARRLMVVTADGATRLFTTEVGDASLAGMEWVGEDHLLVTILHTSKLGVGYLVSKGGSATVVAINVRTGTSFTVFDRHPEVGDIVAGHYGDAQIDGHWYGYFGGLTFRGDGSGWPDLYRVDLDSGAITITAHGDRSIAGWLVGPDGKVVARTTHVGLTGAWQVRTGGFGGRVLASGESQIGDVDLLGLGKTADSVLVARPVGDDGQEVVELPLSGDSPIKPLGDQTIEDVFADPVSKLWIGVRRNGDPGSLEFFSLTANARVRGMEKAFPGLTAHLTSFTFDLGKMIVRTSGSGDSGTLWLVDIAAGSAEPIGNEYPAVKPSDVGTIEMVDWTAQDGLAMHGVLNLPPGRDPKALPVIVMPHGGPEARDYPEFWWWSQLFASRGYAVFQPNFRGSSGYGDAFRNAGFGQWGRKMQTDVSDGLAALAARGIVDPKRACVVGWSYGGYVAQAGVTLQHGLYRCAVSMAGVSDPDGMLGYLNDSRAREDDLGQRYFRAYMGATTPLRSELDAISPVKHARQADAPILLIHGQDDTIVPIAQSQAMARALTAAGKVVTFVALPNADHWLLRGDTRLAMAQASLDFVMKYDPPDPEPAAAAAPKP